jgi:hypothetical protein
MDSGEKGRNVFVSGINDLLSVKLGFLTLSETGINAESMAGSESSFRPYFYDFCAAFPHI